MSSIAAKFSHDVHELDRRERKRLQNRMAQRIYRRNQKQRLQALEAAVANAAALSQIAPSDGSEESLKQDLSTIFGDEDSQHVSDDHDPSQNQLPNPVQWIDALDDAYNEPANEETIQLLLLKGADPNRTNYIGRTALFIAVQTGNEAAAKALLAFPTPRVDVDWRDSTGMVALHLAVDCGLESMTSLLLDHGADVNA
ncbi:putative Ankyrin repeat-containing domain protein [Seiridium unicorne]|uniref:Ankyrin repeat-containing domain protein n=1 Tax=Seiridium unicorne TaxID=138068 RepID=A0ABR2V6X8_9PEZI